MVCWYAIAGIIAPCKNLSPRRFGFVWGDQQLQFLFWDPLYISETNRARKLKFARH